MMMSEPTKEALEKVCEQVSTQTPLKAASCLFTAICTEDGEIPRPGSQVSIANLHIMPEGCNDVLHDLVYIDTIVAFVRARELERRNPSSPIIGGGPVK